jgi:uncharacterized membrane protein
VTAHRLFGAVILLKGLMGLFEVASGGALSMLRSGTVLAWMDWATHGELVSDPHDWLATTLHHWAEGFSHDAQVFAGLYLLAHGVVKVVLAITLLLEKRWAFPVSLALFALLVAFSIQRLVLHWSWFLAGFVLFDLFAIWLIAQEWKSVRALQSAS